MESSSSSFSRHARGVKTTRMHPGSMLATARYSRTAFAAYGSDTCHHRGLEFAEAIPRWYGEVLSFHDLRVHLDRRGYSPELISLPTDPTGIQQVEGGLRVIETSIGFEFVCVNYGYRRLIETTPDREGIEDAVRAFIARPQPPTLEVPRDEFDLISSRLAPFYPPLVEQIRFAPNGVSLIQLPAGVLVDRIGAQTAGYSIHSTPRSSRARSRLPRSACRHRFTSS